MILNTSCSCGAIFSMKWDQVVYESMAFESVRAALRHKDFLAVHEKCIRNRDKDAPLSSGPVFRHPTLEDARTLAQEWADDSGLPGTIVPNK